MASPKRSSKTLDVLTTGVLDWVAENKNVEAMLLAAWPLSPSAVEAIISERLVTMSLLRDQKLIGMLTREIPWHEVHHELDLRFTS